MNNKEIPIYRAVLRSKFIEESTITVRVLFLFIFVALFAQLMFSNFDVSDEYGNQGYASVSIMSYMIILLSILGLVFNNAIVNMDDLDSDTSIVKVISTEMIVLFIYILWLISIYTKYYKHINMRQVPPNFYLYSNFTNLVLMFQVLFFMVRFIVDNDDSIKDEFKKIIFLNYLLSFLNFFLILIQQIILDSFLVDIA
jgi:hypothetical protein